jgi:predicted enzyme related to lactoylglutathione lyase
MTPTRHPAPAWFDISSPDAPRARRFYQEMFGWPVNLLDETYALASGEGGQPTGGTGQAGPGSPYTGSSSISGSTTSMTHSPAR